MLRFAFAGLRHNHIYELVDEVNAHPETTIVAAAESDGAALRQAKTKGAIRITHDDPRRMIEEVDCDVVAIGDVYAWRGPLAIRALELGRHVISDKPPCTRLREWNQIADLCTARRLAFGCQLTIRSDPQLTTARRLIGEGLIGEIQTVTFLGQHPLALGRRPEWYFRLGLHGGTINDIAIHGFDAIEWVTGRRLVEVVAAHAWNAKTKGCRFFQTGAQAMLKMDNQGGVLADVSYLAPERCGIDIPAYWRFTIHGTAGIIERENGADKLRLACDQDEQPRNIPCDRPGPGYFEDFLACVREQQPPGGLDTDTVLRASQLALLTQCAADQNIRNLKIPA